MLPVTDVPIEEQLEGDARPNPAFMHVRYRILRTYVWSKFTTIYLLGLTTIGGA
jgi:hypothetical protein